MSIFLAILGSSVSLGPVSYWALLHREHHQNSDTKKDPHSPQDVYEESSGLLSRLLYAHMGWNYHHRAMRISPTINFHKYHQLTNDLHSYTGSAKLAAVCNLYNLWVILGILLPAVVGGLWVGSRRGDPLVAADRASGGAVRDPSMGRGDDRYLGFELERLPGGPG